VTRKFVLFTKGKADLVKYIHRHGSVLRKDQKIFDSYLGFYFATKILQEFKLIVCNGYVRNNEKEWVLTDKGKEFAKMLSGIERLIGEMN